MRIKVTEWIARYGPAELAGLLGTYLGFWLTMAATHALPVAGYGAALGENIGFYGLIFMRDWRATRDRPRQIFARMLIEFGMAEALDFLIIRPGATILGVMLLGEGWGVLTGKIAADIIFYILAITVYERMKARAAEPLA